MAGERDFQSSAETDPPDSCKSGNRQIPEIIQDLLALCQVIPDTLFIRGCKDIILIGAALKCLPFP